MENKQCYSCRKILPVSLFYKNKTRKDGFQHCCKNCKEKIGKIYIANNPWLKHYFKAKGRCSNKKSDHYKYYGGKGVKFLLSMNEIKIIYNRDNAEKMERPSIDRIDANGNYQIDNCRFIELHDNVSRHKKRFEVIKKTIKGDIVAHYNSIREAIRQNNNKKSKILKSLNMAIDFDGYFYEKRGVV